MDIHGTLSKTSGAFKIAPPLDPENKYILHSFVKSPDMMNIYNGNVALDEKGEAVVTMPEWFEALNRDFRYQLTCIGGFAPVYVAEEIAGNSFKIAGGKAGLKVSWQVTGVRKDPYAEKHRIRVEAPKPESEVPGVPPCQPAPFPLPTPFHPPYTASRYACPGTEKGIGSSYPQFAWVSSMLKNHHPCRVILWMVFVLTFQAGHPVWAAQAGPSKLHVEGRHLKDAQGKVVVLRGVNKPGFVDCPDGWWNLPGGSLYSGIGVWRPQAVEANLDEVRRWGCNVIRFHTCIQWWKENPKTFRDQWRNVTYEKSFREMFKQVVGLAGERGLYVIVDLYSTTAGAAEQEPLPWPPYAKNPGPIGSEQDFLELWKTMAQELAPFPNVLFELFNEPHGEEAAKKAWFAFCQRAIDAIRTKSDNVIIVQWDYGCWVDLDSPPPKSPASTMDWIAKFPLRGDNLVYSTHLYRNSGGGGTFARKTIAGQRPPCWTREDLRRALNVAGVEQVVKELDKPLIVGELGAHMKQEGEELQRELAWLRNVLEALNEWGISYTAWAWDSQQHLQHGLLRPGDYIPAPNEAGEILKQALATQK